MSLRGGLESDSTAVVGIDTPAARSRSSGGHAARLGLGEVMNSTPLLLHGCMAVVSLSLILGYTFRRRPIGRCGCDKVCRTKLRGGSVSSAALSRVQSQRDGGYGYYRGVLVGGSMCSGAGTTADGRRCGENPRPNRERRYL